MHFLNSCGLIFIIIFLHGSFALKCYTCSSDKDSNCPSPVHVKTCDSSNPYHQATNSSLESKYGNETLDYFCMKQYTYIPDWQVSKVDGIEVQKRMTEPRITRYCAELPAQTSTECIGKKSISVRTTTCVCKNELCNSSPTSAIRNTLESQLLVNILAISLVALFMP